MEFTDRLLTCVECGKEFIFTAGEQLFFFDKQFKNDPKRCKPCKSKRHGSAPGKPANGPAAAGISRTETRTHCSECNVETTVPFRPTQGRPVLCRACFQSKRNGAPAAAEVPPQLLAAHEEPVAEVSLAADISADIPASIPPSIVEPLPVELTAAPLAAAPLASTSIDPPAEA